MTGRLRYYLPPILWVAIVLIFSTSFFRGSVTTSYLEKIIAFLWPGEHYGHLKLLNYLIRKTAHLAVYAVLASLWLRAFISGDRLSFGKSVILTLMISLSCAAADEYLQSFARGRTSKTTDVLLDLAAASLALAIVNIGIKKRRTRAASRTV